jgi:two-component system KDP operon response regulator KdpE
MIVGSAPETAALMIRALTRAGHQVDRVDNGAAAMASSSRGYDLIILDVSMPSATGLEVLSHIRRHRPALPVLLVTADNDPQHVVEGLKAGADDYITKPFGVDELLARIRAVTRRVQPSDAGPAATIGAFTIDLSDRSITGGDVDVRLSPTEWQLLEHLLRHPDKLISQRSLLHDVWGPQYSTETNYLRQYMARLRRKLETDPSRPRHLITEPGMGYRYRP